jgi:SNF2 family DNA or RNA helicase
LVHLGGALPRRDRAGEARLTENLIQHYNLSLGRRAECTGRAAIEMAERLRSFEGELVGSDCLARFPSRPLRPTVSTEAAQLTVNFAAGDEDEGVVEVAAEDVLGAWRSGDAGVAIDGGGYAPLPIDWLRRYGDRIFDLLRARDGEGRTLPAARPALLSLCDALDQPRPVDLSKLAPLVDGFDGIPEAELPSDLNAELRPYQQRGVDWLSFLRTAQLGALLADDMGLGKTLQALCAVRGRCLIVCPTSVMHNWAEEAARFRPGLCVGMYHGSKRALDDDWDLTITSYSLLRRDIEKLEAIDWEAIVLDEAHAIKNPDSQVARAAYRLRAPQRIAMSGTPVENRLQELWSQMHFVNPGLLADRETFRERFVEAMESGDGAAAAALRSRIRPFVLRRHKRDVVPELPPRTDMIMYAQLEETEREQYEALKLATRKDAVAKLQAGGNVMAALEALLRLRQMACHPGLVPGGKVDPDGSSSKLRRLSAALDKVRAGGHKALVFSQWTGLLDRLEPGLRRDGFNFVRLDGATRDRGKVVREFQDGEATLMLVSLKAGGTGLNLTAADHVFLLDPWWNPAVEDQAADRAHRIGQDKPVMVYRLVAHDTVEERILVLQEKKRAIAEAVLGEGGAVSGITRDDLLDLLR